MAKGISLRITAGITGLTENRLDRIYIHECCNEHSVCELDYLLEEDFSVKALENAVSSGCEICVSLSGELVYTGRMESFHLSRSYQKTSVCIRAVSMSKELDERVEYRVYQNPDKTLSEIAGFISDEKNEVLCVGAAANEKIEEIIVQHGETDFSFLRRISAEHGCVLFINTKNRSRCRVETGSASSISDGAEKAAEDDSVWEYSIDYCREGGIAEITTDQFYDVGSRLNVMNGRYTVVSRTIIQKWDDLEIRYRLAGNIASVLPQVTPRLSLNMGLGTITDNDSKDGRGRLQVDFMDYENVPGNRRTWIEYISPLTEESGGFVMIPDKGEKVEILYRNGRCAAVGCVREKELEEQLRDVGKRYLYIRNCSLVIDDKSVLLTTGNNKCEINEEMIRLYNDKMNVLIKDDRCMVGCDSTKVVMDQSKVQISGSGQITGESGSIELKGSSGVRIKTASFDVG